MKVKLTKALEYGGKRHRAGETIEVGPLLGRRLLSDGGAVPERAKVEVTRPAAEVVMERAVTEEE